MAWYRLALLTIAFAVLETVLAGSTRSRNDDEFNFSRQPVPDPFRLGDRYPDRDEVVICRPITSYIRRDSVRFTNELVLNSHRRIKFKDADARLMSSRLQTRLNGLRRVFGGRFTVLKSWTDYPDPEISDIRSLHFEGLYFQ